jgi:hypothetical protein
MLPFSSRGPRAEQRLEEENARHVHPADVAPVDERHVAHDLLVERRARRVHVPALDAKAVLEPLDRERLALVRVFLAAAERLRVDEREVREIRQVVDDQQIVRVVVQVVRHAAPRRIRAGTGCR